MPFCRPVGAFARVAQNAWSGRQGPRYSAACGSAAPPLQSQGMARILSTLMMALTMFLVPLGMHVGANAFAATLTAEMVGCEDMSHPGATEQKAVSKASCAVICAAIPVLAAGFPAEAFVDEAKPAIGSMAQLVGIRPDAEIPPPRTIPAI